MRPGLDDPLLDAIDAVPWSTLQHAYGPADDVPPLLHALVLGDGAARAEAWDELIGSVGHQGSVYTATPAVAHVLADLARRPGHPARATAIVHLRFLTASTDPRVDGDAARERALLAELRATAAEAVDALAPGWRDEPDDVRRALVWLLTAAPDRARAHRDLVDAVLPAEHREAWTRELEGREIESQAAFDRLDAFESWASPS